MVDVHVPGLELIIHGRKKAISLAQCSVATVPVM
jgi:hypothetical protein